MLSAITPVILTFNEAPNLTRTLSCLEWAERVVVVDSGSTDGTREIAERFANVSWFVRPFDTQADQWRFAITETDIATPWVLRLDADYVVPEALVRELSRLDPADEVAGYRTGFDFAIHGRTLRGSLYPPNTVLFRPERVSVGNAGHTERWQVNGQIEDLRTKLVHDDRKGLDRWFASQSRYMALELDHLDALGSGELRMTDRLRRVPLVMPVLAFFYCLIGKGLVLDGRAGLHYATQRLVAEAMLSLMLLDRRLGKNR